MSATVAPAAGDPAPPRLHVQNVVAVARVADVLSLADLASSIPGAESPRGNYPGLVLRMTGPRVACHIYDSGKVVLTGLGDVDHLTPAYAGVVDALRAGGADLLEPVPEPRIINLVASGNLGAGVALNRLAIALDLERVEYDPEQFAGLVYRAGGGTALVFASGAIVIMGARSTEGARAVATEVRDVIDRVGAWYSYP